MSSGFKHDPLADVSELAQVLRDQYDAASIPKELIQNADDADAERLHFTWAAGWPNHPHPLLRVPALVVLNDGKFTSQNAEAIQYLRLGSKGGDSSIDWKIWTRVEERLSLHRGPSLLRVGVAAGRSRTAVRRSVSTLGTGSRYHLRLDRCGGALR